MGQNSDESMNKPQNMNIQVSEPFISQIDYSLSREELADYCDQQMELVKSGQKELATIELMMLGYALDFIDFAHNAVQVDIDFDEENLELFDEILEALHEVSAGGGLTQENFNDIVKKATAFFGVFILKNIGGNWVQTNIGMAINLNETNAFVYNRIARRIINGKEDEVVSFYQVVKEA